GSGRCSSYCQRHRRHAGRAVQTEFVRPQRTELGASTAKPFQRSPSFISLATLFGPGIAACLSQKNFELDSVRPQVIISASARTYMIAAYYLLAYVLRVCL